ncbi:hypothetical protein DH2020_013110 [Rehmannia glutinosa]|uniref:Disease resistance protein n=1 Tax=Rehmannia glutinosa TaxID=99300 RepID=A0ABR0X1J0_REHGL
MCKGVKILERIAESFFFKVGEQLVDYAHNTVKNIKDFKSTLDSLQRNLKSLSTRAFDVEEEIKNVEKSGKKKRKREVENWLSEVQTIEIEFLELENEVQSRGFISRFLGGDRAAKLNQRVDELVEQSRHFGELLLDTYVTRGEEFLTTMLVGDAFEENLGRIWEFLVIDKVSIIGIYGMGGVGKTTLMKHINNQLLDETQECVIWVTVSQEFSIKTIQEKIAHDLRLNLSNVYDEDKRAAKLHEELSLRKNIVLIFDDVWKNINLEKVGDPLRVEGCRLVITTRSLEVCRQIGCKEVIAIKSLSTNEAWNLFSEKLGQETILAQEVEEVAKSMMKVCDGLPLGIVTVAGSMKGETAIHVWRNALAELQKSVMGQDEMEKQMHDLVRAMALKISEGKTMALAGHHLKEIPNEEEWVKDLEKISLMSNNIAEIPPGMCPNCPKISTALLLGGCVELVYVPYLGKLKALKELDLSCTAIREVPQGMENLTNLKYLSMIGAKYLVRLPANLLQNFPCIQRLYLPDQIEARLEENDKLKNLEEFQGRVKDVCDFDRFIRSRQNRARGTFYHIQVGLTYNRVILHRHELQKGEEKDVTTMSSAHDILIFHQCKGLSKSLLDDFSRLDDPTSFKDLRISNSRGIECILPREQLMTTKQLEPPIFSNLEKIVLWELPDFMCLIKKQETIRGAVLFVYPLHTAFSSLKYLTICKCNKMKKLGLPVSEFPNLEILSVQFCDEVEEIIQVTEENDVVCLPKLKEMYLILLPRLKIICKKTMDCRSIELLHLEECPQLKKLPLSFPPSTTIETLKEIWVPEDEKEWWESMELMQPNHHHLLQPFLRFWN